MSEKKTLGKAIDEIVDALSGLDENARPTAVRAACEHLGIQGLVHDQTNAGASSDTHVGDSDKKDKTEVGGSAPPTGRLTDIRSLKEQKRPATDAEMLCIVAYYLDTLAPTSERKQEISATDVEKYFKQAGYPLPKRIPQLLVNAKASGYFDSAGRGKYKLNPVGHNLVVHSLPKTKK